MKNPLADLDLSRLGEMSRAEREDLLELGEERVRRASRNKILSYYPDIGEFRRELFKKHLEFFAAGKEHRERCLLASNRSGKTTCGAYETTVHLSGLYPSWWVGHRFDHAVQAWAAGDTRMTTRDIQQQKLMGPPTDIGTGFIPGDLVAEMRPMNGIANAYEQVHVKHVSGGTSILQFRSYDQSREAFQGTERDVIWLDEECPMDIFTECLTRTMATGGFPGGKLMLTFTPIRGMTEVALHFLGHGVGQAA